MNNFWHKKKWQHKWLKIAQSLAEDGDACFSRKVGCVIVSEDNTVVTVGYNGAYRGCDSPDSYEYLSGLWDRLSIEDRFDLFDTSKKIGDFSNDHNLETNKEMTCGRLQGCKTCPRRLLGVPSGERRELCPCACAERNALNNANRSGAKTLGAICFCTHHPCYECAIALIQAGIKVVVYIENSNFPYIDKAANSFLDQAGVEVLKVNIEDGV